MTRKQIFLPAILQQINYQMDTYMLLFLGGLLIGLIVAFATRAIIRQKLFSANEQLKQEQQTGLQLQQEKLHLQSDKEILISRAVQAESTNRFLQQQTDQYQLLKDDHEAIQKQMAILQTQLETAHEKLLNQKQELEAIGEKFRFEFRNLAQGILDEKTAKFTQVNEEKMKAILDPLKTELVDFKKKVDDTYDKESKERFTLGKEVQRLIEMSQLVSQEANNLTTALKGNNKQQGNWGEMILESILSYSGLTKGREYLAQEFIKDNAGNIIKDENGKGLQPDITVLYPDQRKIIIDSKVSLIAWEQYISEDNVDAQRQFLKEHVQSIRSHIEGLSRKNYPHYAQALDYVLLFIPIEPAFLEAVKTDLQLWKFAYDKRIMLVSPTNLLAVLKIIADLWKVELQNQHAIEIADKAGAMYDKFVGFIENLEQVGKKLQDAQQLYEITFKQLSTGRGNIIGRVEELKKMGANANKQLPDKLIPTIITDE
jgi:DNA recombination protein RmuC